MPRSSSDGSRRKPEPESQPSVGAEDLPPSPRRRRAGRRRGLLACARSGPAPAQVLECDRSRRGWRPRRDRRAHAGQRAFRAKPSCAIACRARIVRPACRTVPGPSVSLPVKWNLGLARNTPKITNIGADGKDLQEPNRANPNRSVAGVKFNRVGLATNRNGLCEPRNAGLVSAADAAHAAVFPLFERHATTVTAAAEALRQMLQGGEHVSQHCRDVVRYEEEADGITREVLIGIRSTFITPFDRGDIKDLITSLDDAIDEMQTDGEGNRPLRAHHFRAGYARHGGRHRAMRTPGCEGHAASCKHRPARRTAQ